MGFHGYGAMRGVYKSLFCWDIASALLWNGFVGFWFTATHRNGVMDGYGVILCIHSDLITTF